MIPAVPASPSTPSTGARQALVMCGSARAAGAGLRQRRRQDRYLAADHQRPRADGARCAALEAARHAAAQYAFPRGDKKFRVTAVDITEPQAGAPPQMDRFSGLPVPAGSKPAHDGERGAAGGGVCAGWWGAGETGSAFSLKVALEIGRKVQKAAKVDIQAICRSQPSVEDVTAKSWCVY